MERQYPLEYKRLSQNGDGLDDEDDDDDDILIGRVLSAIVQCNKNSTSLDQPH